MKILYFYQYFSTPNGSWGTRVYEFAKKWVNEGHEVIVVTSIYAKSDLNASKLIETQFYDGIEVKVINIKIDNRQTIIRRIWTFLIFLLLAGWYAIRIKADVVIASSGPISVGALGLLSRLKSKKLVFEVRDLWPEGAITLGILRNKLLIKLAFWFEKKCYLYSDHIITLSPGMKDNIYNRYGYSKITTIPNAANIQLFNNESDVILPAFFKENSIAIYTGNIGRVNNSTLLVDTARVLNRKKVSGILILLIGEGKDKDKIKNIIKKEKLNNLLLLDLIPKRTLVHYLKNSMVSLVPLEASPIWDTSSPNKLFESLAAGIPVIQTTQGWIKELFIKYKCGFTISPDKPEELANLLIELRNRKPELKTMGKNARRIAEEMFDKDILAESMLKVLKSTIDE